MNKRLFSLLFFSFFFLCTFAQAPTGLSGTGYRTTVHLQWDDYTGFEPIGFNIYRSTSSGNFGAPARRIGAYNDYTDYNLTAGTTYYYKISAFDGSGNESALSSEITVSTNNNNYLKVASLDLLIPIYKGGISATAPQEIRQGLEFAREIFFRNSHAQLNLKFHFMEIDGFPPPNANNVADFNTIGADLTARGILDNQYDAIHIEAVQLYGWFGGALWLGETAGSMGYNWTGFDADNHYSRGDAWLFTHEFGHSLDLIIANRSGYPEMIYNHFAWAHPMPPEIGVFDAGENFDGMALILRLFEHHLEYQAPYDGYFEVIDVDNDGLPDNDARLVSDEMRFGSNTNSSDTDNDGLNDLGEFTADVYQGSSPTLPDTDGDGVNDGQDIYPASNFQRVNEKTDQPINVDGSLSANEGWHPMGSNPYYSKIPNATLNTFTTWDGNYLYFAFQSNQHLKYYLKIDGSGEDGIFASPVRWPGGDYSGFNENAWGNSYFDQSTLIIRADDSQVYKKEAPIAGSQVQTVFSNGTYTTEIKLPHNLGPGFGFNYTDPNSPTITELVFSENDIIGIQLLGMPLASSNAYEWNEWRVNDWLILDQPFHYYDMVLTGGGSTGDYCNSTSNFPWEDWIANVSVGSIDNTSTKAPYSDFTNLTTDLEAGTSPSIAFTAGYSYFTYDEYWRVWIDLNQNGDFTDPDEMVFSGVLSAPTLGTPAATLNGNLTIPATALTGSTRMRVSMKRDAFPTPCETLPFGEVEDYTVNIQMGVSGLEGILLATQNNVPPSGATFSEVRISSFDEMGNTSLVSNISAPVNSNTTNFNGNAYDRENGRFYFSRFDGDNLASELFFNDLQGNQQSAGMLGAAVTSGTFYNGAYYYIGQQSDGFYRVTFNPDGTIASHVLIADFFQGTIYDGQWLGLGDIAFSPNGAFVYGSATRTGGATPSTVFFRMNADGSDYTEICNQAACGFQAGSTQIAFGTDGQLYGANTLGNREFWRINSANGSSEFITNLDLSFSDLAMGNGPLSFVCEGDITLSSQAEVDAFGPCTVWDGNITIEGTDITNLNSLSGLIEITGYLIIQNCPQLGNLDGLNELTSTGSHFAILSSQQLENVDAMTQLSFVGGDFVIIENSQLINVDGFSALTTIQGQIIVSDNAMLQNLNGLSAISYVGTSVEFYNNDQLTSISILTGQTEINGSLTIVGNDQLTHFNGLSNVESVQSTLVVIDNPSLTSIQGLASLQSGSTLVIDGNDELKDLNPLSNLSVLSGGLFVENNNNLSNCCGLFPILSNNGVSGDITIENNPSFCSSVDEIIANCSGSVDYCTSQGNFPWEEWIGKVKVADINNASNKSQYSDFTNISTTIEIGVTPIQLTANYSYFTWDEYWSIWIDFNHDGDFTDGGEIVMTGLMTAPPIGTASKTHLAELTIPSTVMTGPTRMRVSMKRGGFASPCEVFQFGEVEDYNVNITPGVDKPDLIVTNVDAPTSANAGDVFDVTFDLENIGNVYASTSETGVFLSTDNIWDASDPQVGDAGPIIVDPMSSWPFTVSVSIPTTTTPSSYYLLFVADYTGLQDESNENNNTTTAPFEVLGTGQLPNLQIVGPEIIPANNCYTNPGQSLAFLGGLVLNSGMADAGAFKVKAYISKDEQLDGGDVFWQEFSYAGLNQNNTVGWNVDAPVPMSISPGQYYVLIRADADNDVVESNENDNLLSLPTLIGAPDFTISNVNGVPASTTEGSAFNVDVEVTHLVSFPLLELIGNLPVRIYLSDDDQFSSFQDLEIGTANIDFSQFSNGPLYNGGTAMVNISAQLPISIDDGQYFIFANVFHFCEISVLNNTSGAIPVQIGGSTPTDYCPSISNFPWEDWISRVKINDLDHSSTKSSYSDFTNQTAHLQQGLQYAMTLSVGYSYLTYDEYWKVWIDFNHDGVFGSNENVLSGILPRPVNGTPSASITQNVSIPSGALTGPTRMRVSMKRNDFASPCETLPFGEVEDYTVDIQPTTTNLPNLFISFINLPTSSMAGETLDGEFRILNDGTVAVSGTYSVGWYFSFDNVFSPDDQLIGSASLSNTPVGNSPLMPVSVTIPASVNPGDYYLFMVVDDNDEVVEINEFDNTVFFDFLVLGSGPSDYCTSISAFPWHEWISAVEINGQEMTSGKSNYSDFTGTTFTLNKSSSQNTVQFTGTYSYFTYREYWKAWVDFNHNGIFEDSERLFEGFQSNIPPNGINATQSISGNVGPFPNALSGPTRMRVSMKRFSAASPCEEIPFGEVEDYTVNISESFAPNNTGDRASNLAFEARREMTWVNLYGIFNLPENVMQIEIEKSADNNSFELINTISEQKEKDEVHLFTAKDEQPFDGDNYYRLLFILENGEEIYGPVSMINFNRPLDFTLFPNPASSELFIYLNEKPEGEINMRINDAFGRQLKFEKISLINDFTYRINISDLKPGMYYLFIEQKGKKAVSKRFVVAR